jgi:hypothetical protein
MVCRTIIRWVDVSVGRERLLDTQRKASDERRVKT